ncbi:hypothetical protein ACROYT_G024308 [Oculina patagonica]
MAQNNNNLSVARDFAASVKTLLGPELSLKGCTSDGEAVICSSTAKLLQFIDIQHPAGFIINDACQGQYKKYRTNCKTLVCLAGFWSSTVQDLQDQGVPVPIIVRLLDDALEVCEEVCQEMSIPVMKALQSDDNLYPPAKDYEVTDVEDVKGSTVDHSCCPDAGSGRLEKSDVVDGGDDDNDISWYFDGRIPGADGLIPRVDGHFPGVDGHISGVGGILGAFGNIPGLPSHITGTDINIPGATNMNVFDAKISDQEISRNRFAASSNENPRNILLGAEYEKSAEDMEDTNDNIKDMAPPWVNLRRPGTFPNTPSVNQKDKDFTFNLASEGRSSSTKHVSNLPSTSLKSTGEPLLSKKEDKYEEDDDDEFEASFQDVVSNSANEDLGGQFLELSVAKEHEILPSGVRAKGFADTCQKTNCTKRENTEVDTSNNTNKKLVNPISLSSSGGKGKEVSDKLLSLLSEKLESKNKSVRRQFKMSEILKGSRHFQNNWLEEPVSKMTSSSIVNQSRDIFFNEERYRKSETSSASKTCMQSILKTGQTGKPDLVNSTPCNRKTGQENIAEQNLDSFVSKKTEESKLIERNKQLLSELGSRLCHGKEQEMQLAVEVVNSLFHASGKTSLEDFEIHLRMIHTELVQSPPSSFSHKIDGLLLESTASYQSASESQFFIALVDGDVTPEFRHVGLNKEFQIHRIIENKDDFKASLFNQEKDWYQCVTKTLCSHKIGLLVVKGIVHDSVLDFSLSHDIAVLQNVAYPSLQLLSFATDSTIVTYLADIRNQDIGRPVTIETWELGWTPLLVRPSKSKVGGDRNVTGMKAGQYVLVKEVQEKSASCEDSNSPLQTVLLCNPCKDVLCDMEERFWNSIYRLKNALSCGRVLPGAGEIELACIRRLDKLAGEQNEPKVSLNPLSGWLQGSLEMFRPLVYAAFAQGFREFLGNVLQNSGKFTTPCGVSAHVEQLVNSGCSLDILGSFNDENSEDNQNEVQNTEGITRHHARGHASYITASDRAGSGSPIKPAGSKCLSFDVESLVWDDYTAKKEAWRRAVGIVRILLQSDMLVQTGLGGSENEAVLF